MVLIGGEGVGGAGGGGFFVVTGSPFADTAARDTWAAANTNELVINQALAQITGGDWYLYTGPNTDDWIVATPFVQGPPGADGMANIPGVADGTITQVTGGALQGSSMRETTDNIEFDKSAMLPGGTLSLEGFEVSNPGGQLLLKDTASSITYSVSSRPFDEATGSGQFSIDNIQAATTQPFQTREDETLTDSELAVNFTEAQTAYILEWQSSSAIAGSGKFYIVIHRGTSASDPVWYRSHTPAQVAAEDVFSLDGGNTTHDTRAHPTLLVGGQQYYARFIGVGGNFTAGGTTITQADIDGGSIFTVVGQKVPFYNVRFQPFSQDRVALYDEIMTTAQIRDTIAAMVTGGANNGLTATRNGNVIDFTVTGGTPQPGPSITNFSINIPATVDLNTDLNVSKTASFTIAQASEISNLDLVVTTGTDQALLAPSADGAQSQDVTLAGIDTSAAGTVTFQIRGTTTGGQTIMSNSQTVTVRAVQAHELAYYWVSTSANYAAQDLNAGAVTSIDVTTLGVTADVNISIPNGSYLNIIYPQNRPITSIIEQPLGTEALTNFAETANARTIGSEAYNGRTHQNNSGFDGTYRARITF